MLRFTVNIPALNNSPQLKEFFRTGDVTMRSDGPDSADTVVLPPPLIPQPVRSSSTEVADVKEELDSFEDTEPPVSPEVLPEVEETISSSEPSQFDLLFDLTEDICQLIGEEETTNPTIAPKTLAPNDLVLFDPCYAE
ncbi:hypothetical protein GDO81_027396, partial [Engystomops pustulosus]